MACTSDLGKPPERSKKTVEQSRRFLMSSFGHTLKYPSLEPDTSGLENLAAEILPAELRETLLRLCQQEAADGERQEELQRHLEAASRARHGLERQHW